MTFYVGQKLICINADRVYMHLRQNGLVKGAVYTVTATGLVNPYDPLRLPAIFVAELRLSCPVWASRFRPIVERKTDISIFTAMLTPNKTRVGA